MMNNFGKNLVPNPMPDKFPALPEIKLDWFEKGIVDDLKVFAGICSAVSFGLSVFMSLLKQN